MLFSELPHDAQHQALSTLREMITAGNIEDDDEPEVKLAQKIQKAFISLYESPQQKSVLTKEEKSSEIANKILKNLGFHTHVIETYISHELPVPK